MANPFTIDYCNTITVSRSAIILSCCFDCIDNHHRNNCYYVRIPNQNSYCHHTTACCNFRCIPNRLHSFRP